MNLFEFSIIYDYLEQLGYKEDKDHIWCKNDIIIRDEDLALLSLEEAKNYIKEKE